MSLIIPDKLIQRAIDNGFNPYPEHGEIKAFEGERRQMNDVMLTYSIHYEYFFPANHIIGELVNNYELIFSLNLKFLKYAVRDNVVTDELPYRANWEKCLIELANMKSSEEQSEYLKTLI